MAIIDSIKPAISEQFARVSCATHVAAQTENRVLTYFGYYVDGCFYDVGHCWGDENEFIEFRPARFWHPSILAAYDVEPIA